MAQADVTRIAVAALYDAADDDSATGGPDLTRGIFPIVTVVDADGYRRLTDDELEPIIRELIVSRTGDSGGSRGARGDR